MRSAGRIVAEVLALVEEPLAAGRLDRRARPRSPSATSARAKGVPSFLNYLGGRRYDARDPHAYPASTCISIDDEIVHGIPGDREIKAGQLVSVDVGVIYDDWHGDGARTFICGGPEAATRRGPRPRRDDPAGADGRHRRRAARQLHRRHLGARSRTSRTPRRLRDHPPVRRATASAPRCTRTRRSPTSARRSKGLKLEPGPVPRDRADAHARLRGDRRRSPTAGRSSPADGSLAAHFEHTIAVTADGPEILTTV